MIVIRKLIQNVRKTNLILVLTCVSVQVVVKSNSPQLNIWIYGLQESCDFENFGIVLKIMRFKIRGSGRGLTPVMMLLK